MNFTSLLPFSNNYFLHSLRFQSRYMKKIFSIAIYLFNVGFLFAQNDFYRKDDIPVLENGNSISNAWAGGTNAALFSEIDLNGDGIKDLFVFDATNNRIETFVNNGTAGNVDYQYQSTYAKKFPILNKWAFLKDYNCDGKEDIFCYSDVPGSVRVYRNDYTTANGLQFTLITDQLTCTYQTLNDYVRATAETHPAFSDVDKDGDLDLLGWPDVPNGRVVYYQNKAVELGLPCDSISLERVTDCWGRFQLAFGTNAVSGFNIPCAFAMAVNDPDQPLIAKKDDTLSSLFAVDIDNDNDDDLLIGDVGSPHSLMIVNGGDSSFAQMVSQDTIFPSYNIPSNINSFLSHAYIDADNDGKKDLLVSSKRENLNTGIAFFKDTSISSVPAFKLTDSVFLQNNMIDLGRAVYPSFFDYNSDGLMDLIVGNENYEPIKNNITVGLALFKNTGTINQPAFDLIDRNYADFNAVASGSTFLVGCAPAFGDFDSDGDKDMIIGSENGQLFLFTNNPSGGIANFTFTTFFLDSIDIGNYSAPSAVDLDRDGLIDLVLGRRNGRLSFFKNIGTASSPDFTSTPTVDTLGDIILHGPANPVTGYTTPYLYDDNGTYKMFIGCETGEVYAYDSIENNINGTWHLAKTVINKTEGRFTSVAANDLNNDGFIDLAVGNWCGGLGILYQQNTNAIQDNTANNFNFILRPNPASSEVMVHLDDTNLAKHETELNIYNQFGQLIKRQAIINPVTAIDLQSYSNGIYFLRVSNKEISILKRLVLLH